MKRLLWLSHSYFYTLILAVYCCEADLLTSGLLPVRRFRFVGYLDKPFKSFVF